VVWRWVRMGAKFSAFSWKKKRMGMGETFSAFSWKKKRMA
jgi:hypothetical protein